MQQLQLQDRLEIDALITEYAFLADHRRWQDVAGLCTDDAVLTVRGHEYIGHSGIAMWAEARAAHRARRTQHQITNIRLEAADADHVTGCSTLVLHLAKHGGGSFVDLVGEYRDEYVRAADGWRFARRELVELEDV